MTSPARDQKKLQLSWAESPRVTGFKAVVPHPPGRMLRVLICAVGCLLAANGGTAAVAAEALPGLVRYKGAGMLPWPGSVPAAQLPAEFREPLEENALTALREAAVTWCRQQGLPEEARRIASLSVQALQPAPPDPALFWPVPEAGNNPLIRYNRDWDFLLLHPQSPRRGDPELLKQALNDLFMWAEKPVDRDHSRQALLMFLRLKSTYPQLLPGPIVERVEKRIRDTCARMAGGEEGGLDARYADDTLGHLKPNHALKSATLQHLAGRILGDRSLVERAARVMDTCYKHLQPDGAVRYAPVDVPDLFYLIYNTNHLLEYWLVSGNPQAHAMLVTMAARIPLYLLPFREGAAGDMPFRIAGGNQSHYWHGYDPTHCAESYVEAAWRLAMVSGLRETAGHPLAVRWRETFLEGVRAKQSGVNLLPRFDPFLYRPDLANETTRLEGSFLFHGRNENGPVGRFGDWAFRMNGLARSRTDGVRANYWAGHGIGFYEDWPWFVNVTGRAGASAQGEDGLSVTSMESLYFGVLGAEPRKDPFWATFRGDKLGVRAAATTTSAFGALSTSAVMPPLKRPGLIATPENPSPDDQQWQEREIWLGTPERLVGCVEITLLRDLRAGGIGLYSHFKVNRQGVNLLRDGEHFRAGDLVLRVVDTNLNLENARLGMTDVRRHFQSYGEGGLTLPDPSVPAAGDLPLREYPAGTRLYALVELYNPRLTGPADISCVRGDEGLWGLTVREKDATHVMFANHGGEAASVAAPDLLAAGADGDVFLTRSGARYRPPQLDFLVSEPHPLHAPTPGWGPARPSAVPLSPEEASRMLQEIRMPGGAHLVLSRGISPPETGGPGS